MVAIPNARKYERSATPSVPSVDKRRHGQLDAAARKNDREVWKSVLTDFIQASKEDLGAAEYLRPNVRNRFFEICPHEDLVFRLRQETGQMPKRETSPSFDNVVQMPLVRKGPPASEIARKKARAEEERARRASLKGGSGQKKSLPNSGKGKGGKKK